MVYWSILPRVASIWTTETTLLFRRLHILISTSTPPKIPSGLILKENEGRSWTYRRVGVPSVFSEGKRSLICPGPFESSLESPRSRLYDRFIPGVNVRRNGSSRLWLQRKAAGSRRDSRDDPALARDYDSPQRKEDAHAHSNLET